MFVDWGNFFYLVGSAAAELIGLMFVVVTLISGRDRAMFERAAAFYLTPTLVQFGVVFAICAVAQAQALPATVAAVGVGLFAALGLACAIRATVGLWGSHRRGVHWSDFWAYALLPAVAYAAILALAAATALAPAWARLALAGALLTLLLAAIRNAWDTITAIAARRGEEG